MGFIIRIRFLLQKMATVCHRRNI